MNEEKICSWGTKTVAEGAPEISKICVIFFYCYSTNDLKQTQLYFLESWNASHWRGTTLTEVQRVEFSSRLIGDKAEVH